MTPITIPKTWPAKKEYVFNVEGRTTCEVHKVLYGVDYLCGAPATDAGHGAFGRNAKFKKFVDDILNLCPSCEDCNRWIKNADRWETRFEFFKYQYSKHPKEVTEWMSTAPAGIRRGDEWKRYNRYIGGEV